MRKILVIFVLFILGFYINARERICIDKGWRFHIGHANDINSDFNFHTSRLYGKTAENYGTCIVPDFDDSMWEEIDIPHDWAVFLPFDKTEIGPARSHGYKAIGPYYPQNSIGWYRKTFNLPLIADTDRVLLRFDGVFRNSHVWINNFYLGNHSSGYTSFSYDITDFVSKDKENVIVVRVDASQIEGWFYEGAGIYRHVWLETYGNLHFKENGVFVKSSFLDDIADVNVGYEIVSWKGTTQSVRLAAVVKDNTGLIVSESLSSEISVEPDSDSTFFISLNIKEPKLWNIDNPHLYTLETKIISGNNVVLDENKVRFGIRNLTFSKDKGLYLNGSPLKIKGVCCHQDHAGVGSAIPDFLNYYRIELLKAMGANAYRCSHNPPTPELLDACDSLGLLVVDETRLTNSGPEYMYQWESLIKRDRNHPSIMMWSIGNEEEKLQSDEVGKKIALSMIRKLRQLDNTRPVTYGANNGEETKGINEVVDIRGFNYNLDGLLPYRMVRPDQPIIGTEVGSTVTTRGVYKTDTINNYLTDYDENFPPWATTAETWWTIADEYDWFMGGFVWTGFDYRGEPTPFEWPNISSHFGVMDICGFPKNVYWYYKSWWTEEDVLNIAPHWNHNTGDTVKVWINSNAEKVSLSLNGTSLGTKCMPHNGHLEWMVPFCPGKLKAVAYKQGRMFETTVETVMEPTSILLQPYKSRLVADGCDGTVINVSVIDRKGRPVATASNTIFFSIEGGDAKIIGVGNGDPSCHEPDKCNEGEWRRSLFNGKCQVILQSGMKPSDIKLIAKADGLKSCEIILNQIKQ